MSAPTPAFLTGVKSPVPRTDFGASNSRRARLLADPTVLLRGGSADEEEKKSEPTDTTTIPPFPESLGPFDIVPTKWKNSAFNFNGKFQEGAMVVIEESVFKSDALKSIKKFVPEFPIIAQTSPVQPVNLDDNVKKKAKIPQNAKWFCWLYPIALNDDIFKENSGAKLGDSECTLLTVGGYVYFDKDKKVVQVNTLVPGNTGLFFGPPKKFDKNWIPDLQKKGRFHQITIKPLRDAGARHFCWIRPNEPIVEYVSQNVTKKKILCPFGGFAYLFNDNPYQHDERNRYFEILGKEQYQQEFAKLQKANASASVPKSKRFALVGEKLATLAKLQRELSAARKKKSEAGSGLSPQKAASWTKEQVQTWLKENQFEKYAQSFFEEDVDGEILLGIEEADLDGMKVSRMHRKKLMRLVNELKKDGEVSAADAEKAAAASATEKAIKEMELQIFRLKSELQDTRVCNCCYTNKKCAFQPCGHLFACTDCAKELVRKPCPLCRRRVTSYIAVYI